MYQKTKIIDCFEGLVGWHGGCGEDPLNAIHLTSTSGYYVDDLPGVTWPVILECLEEWHGGINAYLTKVHQSELYTCLDTFINNNKAKYISKELMANQPLFSGDVDFTDIVTKTQGAHGFLFRARESNNLITELKHLGLQLSTGQTLRIFLYDTAHTAAVATYDFVYGATGTEIWKEVTEFIINYQTLDGSAGRTFLLLWYEVNDQHSESWQLSSRVDTYYVDFCCDGCNLPSRKVWQRWISCRPVDIPLGELNWNTDTYDLPDMTNTLNGANYSTKSAGLNAKVNVTCDISLPICHNKDMFAQGYQIKIALKVLNDVLMTSRFNAIADSSVLREQIVRFINTYTGILEGTTKGFEFPGGDTKLMHKKGIVDNWTDDFSDIDSVCLKKKAEVELGRKTRNYI